MTILANSVSRDLLVSLVFNKARQWSDSGPTDTNEKLCDDCERWFSQKVEELRRTHTPVSALDRI